MIKSHIFPKFLLKQWILYFWNQDKSKYQNLYKIDLNNSKFYYVEIKDEKNIRSILDSDKTFYLDIVDELIDDNEKSWSKNYENPFDAKINNIFNKFYEEALLKNKNLSSLDKDFLYRMNNLTEKNNKILIKFLSLNLVRAKLIRDSIDFSEKELSEKLSKNPNYLNNKIKKQENKLLANDYNLFIIAKPLDRLPSPPIFNSTGYFYCYSISSIRVFMDWILFWYLINICYN